MSGDAYQAGWRAANRAHLRLTRDDNPYDDGDDWAEWDRGFAEGLVDAEEAAAEYRAEAAREERWLSKLHNKGE